MGSLKEKAIFNRNFVKILIMFTMFIDHFAYTLILYSNKLPYNTYYLMRGIGRITFPLYCFLFVEGVYYTRDKKLYGLRLIAIALISEIVYDSLFYDGLSFENQNVIFLYFLALVFFFLVGKIEDFKGVSLWLGASILLCFSCKYLNIDYSYRGGLLVSFLYLIRFAEFSFLKKHQKELQALAIVLLNIYQARGINSLVYLSALVAYFYDDFRADSSKAFKVFNYLYYPGHLFVLFLLKLALIA